MRRQALVAVLAAVLVIAGSVSGRSSGTFDQPLAANKQAAHVLNRLAYGPRPGDLDDVRRMGVDEWMRAQLRPERLAEDPALASKLEPMESLHLPTARIVEKYQPSRPGSMATVRVTPTGVFVVRRVTISADLEATITRASGDERRAIINGLPGEQRRSALIALPLALFEGLPEQAEALKARADNASAMAAPLISAEQFRVLQSGGDDEKEAILLALAASDRALLLGALPPQNVPAAFRRQAMAASQPQQLVTLELIDNKLYRAVQSTHQLEEVLVDFWLNHFNVFSGKGAVRLLLTSYERDAIRPHVFGRFRDLLLATAQHPAMLFYLDNWMSQRSSEAVTPAAPPGGAPPRAPGLNENYGRELLELHTLGVDGGYTQADVVNVARAFTGWTIREPNRYGEFQFNPAMHDLEEKVVLGRTIPSGGGESDGLTVIELLSRHRSTAHFISRKLAQRFVADDPPASLVDRMADTFLKTDGDLRAVYETMLFSREFQSEGAWRAKLKSPLELVTSALRALNADVTDTTAIAQRIADLGQPLYAKPEPTGYPNTSDMWASSASLLGRINFATALATGHIPGVAVRPDHVDTEDVAQVGRRLLGSEPSPATLAAIEKGLAEMPRAPGTLVTVLLASPDFQQR